MNCFVLEEVVNGTKTIELFHDYASANRGLLKKAKRIRENGWKKTRDYKTPGVCRTMYHSIKTKVGDEYKYHFLQISEYPIK